MLNSHTLPLTRSLIGKIIMAIALTAVADFLFYWQPIGCNVAIYAALLLVALTITHSNILHTLSGRLVFGLCVGLLYAMAEEPDILTLLMYASGIGTLLLLTRHDLPADIRLWYGKLWRFWLLLPFHQRIDRRMLKHTAAKRVHFDYSVSVTLLKYAAPTVILSLAFIILFASANPLLKHVLDQFAWGPFVNILSPLRWGFWLAVSSCLWGLLRPRFSRIKRSTNLDIASFTAFWFSEASIACSLACFNLVFAVQNGLDIFFLWSGGALPAGQTYASYAQAGAYPLMVTALLAAGYVLLTFGTDRPATPYRPMARGLVYIWIAQNIFLLISAINRNIQYIEAYSLTYTRLVAMIWMALVALGFGFIVMKLVWHKSNIWLINANSFALLTTLYGACFVNFAGFIADYNVHHAREVTGQGPYLDMAYMTELGCDALPALYWYENNITDSLQKTRTDITATAIQLRIALGQSTGENWRGLTLRRQRLLELVSAAAAKTSPTVTEEGQFTAKPSLSESPNDQPAAKTTPSQPLYGPPQR